MMKKKMNTSVHVAVVLVLACLVLESAAFVPSAASRQQQHHHHHGLLHLTPQQSSELIQAYEDLYHHDDDDDEHDEHDAVAATPEHKQRSFVSRVFHMPASLWHPHPKAEGVPLHTAAGAATTVDIEEEDEEEDVVYFPVVGFTFVKDGLGHSRPLSKVTNASCRLHSENEPVYGWFRPNNEPELKM